MVLTASGHSMVVWRRRVRLTRVNSLILRPTIAFFVVKDHPTVDTLLSAGLDYLPELGLCEPSIFLPLGPGPGPVGGCQALVGILGPNGLLS